MPPVEYHAAPRSPHEVAADLCRLWSENLGLAMTPEQKFQWLYRDAPEPSDLVFVLEAIADGHTVIVGTNGMASRRFRVAGRDARAAISCDLAVDRAHRSLLPALSLVRAVREAGTTRFDFVYGFPNAKAEGVLKRAGFRELGRARRWAKVLRHARYVDRLSASPDATALVRLASSHRSAAKLGAGILDTWQAVARTVDAARVGVKHRLRSHRAPDDRWEVLWRDARDEYDVVGERTPAFLRWRFPPGTGTRFVTLQRRGDQRLRAAAVLQFDEATGAAHVRDLFGHHDSFGTLISGLVPHAHRSGASSLSVRFLGAPSIERLLVAHGFTRRKGDRCVVIEVGPAVAEHHAILTDASRWHLFDADEDA